MNNQNPAYPLPTKEEISQTAPAVSQEKLKKIGQLLKESWQIYRNRLKAILGIGLIWVIINFLYQLAYLYRDVHLGIFVAAIIFFLISLFFSLLVLPVLIYCIKDNIGVKESYKKGINVFIQFFWAYILVTLIATGGFMLFIIPGFIFTIWFGLWAYVMVFEEKKGMAALSKSKDLVTGKFWAIWGRFLALGLILGIIIVAINLIFSLIVSFLTNALAEPLSNLISLFVSGLLIAPLSIIYGILIYQNLAKIKAGIVFAEPSQGRKIKYGIIGILGIPLLAVLLIFITVTLIARDIPPIDDSDLLLQKVEIPETDNAFYPLEQAVIKMNWPKDNSDLINKIIKKEDWDANFVAEVVNSNQEALDYFSQAASLSQYQIPAWQDPETVGPYTFYSLANTRNLARLNAIKAAYLFSQGREKEAFDEAIKVIKIGQMIQDSHAPIVHYLVALAIKNIGLEELRTLVSMTSLPKEELKSYIVQLEKFKENEEGLIKVFKMEYMGIKNMIDNLPEYMNELGGMPIDERMAESSYFFQPNRTKKLFAEYSRSSIVNIEKDYCKEVEFIEIKSLSPFSWKIIFTQNAVGRVLHDMIAVSLREIVYKNCQEDFSVIGTQVLMAIRAYQAETGRLPNSLGELVPEYFSAVPKDPFDGQLTRYLPDKKIIYSVGDDFVDSGGSMEEKTSILLDTKEPTIKIKF